MDFISRFLEYLNSAVGVLLMGGLGALFEFLLSKEPLRDKTIGAICGLILCIAFAQHLSNVFAGGQYPEVFGFMLGAMGKSTAELLLDKLRENVVNKLNKK